MNIKFDFWVTPDGYTGDGHPSIGRAYHVKGGVDLPKAPLLALLSTIIYVDWAGLRSDAMKTASRLIDEAEEKVSG